MITPESVLAARDDARPTGERYCELAMTGSIIAGVSPMGRRAVAGFLRGILGREPLAHGAAYEVHRSILGALLLELESFAVLDAGEIVEAADLRDPAVVAKEREAVREFREWAELERRNQAAAVDLRITEALIEGSVGRDQVFDRLEETAVRVQAWVDAPSPPAVPAPVAQEASDAPDWL